MHHIATIFISIALPATSAQQTDDVQNHILRIHPGPQLPFHIDAAHLHLTQRHRLSRQNIPHLSRPNAKRNRSKCPMRRRVAIATSDRRPWLRDPLLGSHHVHDPLFPAAQTEIRNSKLLHVPVQFLDHLLRQRIRKWRHLAVRRNNVIHRCKRPVRIRHLQSQISQHPKRLRARHLVNQMRVDQQLRLSVVQSADRV